MSGYFHLTAEETDRVAGLTVDGLSLRAIAGAVGRAASIIWREIRRNALDSGVYRPHVAVGGYMMRRQRGAALESYVRLAALAVWRCFLRRDLSPSRIWSMIPTNGSSFGLSGGPSRRYPGGTECFWIFDTVLLSIPNNRAASLLLIPSTWHARRTRA